MEVDIFDHHLVSPLCLCCCCLLSQVVLPAVAPKVHSLPEFRVLGEQPMGPGPHQRIKHNPAQQCIPSSFSATQGYTGACMAVAYLHARAATLDQSALSWTYPAPLVAAPSLLDACAAAAAAASPPSCQASCNSSTLNSDGWRGCMLYVAGSRGAGHIQGLPCGYQPRVVACSGSRWLASGGGTGEVTSR